MMQCSVKRIALAALLIAGLAAPAAATTVFTAAQLQAADSGLEMMRELNVITYGNLNSDNHVQGKAFVGGSLYGKDGSSGTSNATFGQGNGSASETANSSRATLTVVGSTNSTFTLQNGGNGASGTISSVPSVQVGVDLANTTNLSPDGWSVQVGRNLGAIQNVASGPSITYGNSYAGSNTGNGRIAKDASLANASTGLAATLSGQRATMVADLNQLSAVLGNLSTNITATGVGTNTLNLDFSTLSASSSNTNYGAYSVTAATLFSYATVNIAPGKTSDGNYRPIVINVTGGGSYLDTQTNINLPDAIAQDVIFNFVDASSLTINSTFNGSILAPNATLTNGSNITGSVVANVFNQNAQVHLGTYQGVDSFVRNDPVPETSTWAMMLGGFGVIGGGMRRRRRIGHTLSA